MTSSFVKFVFADSQPIVCFFR